MCSRSAADPRAPARRRHWAGAPRLPPRLARAAGAGPGTSHVEVAPLEHLDFLLAWLAQQVQDPAHHTWRSRPSCRFRSTARARLPTSRERDWCMQERNIPLFYKFLSAAIRQAAECLTGTARADRTGSNWIELLAALLSSLSVSACVSASVSACVCVYTEACACMLLLVSAMLDACVCVCACTVQSVLKAPWGLGFVELF